MSKLQLTSLSEPLSHPDTLRIDVAKKSAVADFSRITFTDKDTHQIVHYVPALDISGYGETEQKADEMLRLVAENLFTYLLSLSAKSLQKELREMGFKQTPLKNKEFSRVVVDENGQLQNLNAIENSIKHSSLSLAA